VTAASAGRAAGAPAVPGLPSFNSLFRDQDRRAAVDPVIAALWSVPADAPAPDVRQPPKGSAVVDPGPSFDLFRDQAANTRALFGGSI